MGKVKDFALVALGALGGASYVTYKAIDYITSDESAKKAFKSYVSDKMDKTVYRKSRKPKYDVYYDHAFNSPLFDTRSDAEAVLDTMNELIETYGVATIADLYDLAGAFSLDIDNEHGWTNIRNAYIIRVYDRYIIKFPKPTRVY